MKLSRLEISQFTAFEHVVFEFGSELNVFIGENATGKSHILKLLYVVIESVRRATQGLGLDGVSAEGLALSDVARELLRSVFLPDELGRLVRRGARQADVVCTWGTNARVELRLYASGIVEASLDSTSTVPQKPLFVPPRDVLAIYPGFVAAWLNRESAFDRTYYDLCVALGLKELRKTARTAARSKLLELLEQTIEARVHKQNDRFYFKDKADGGDTEAPLAAEGHRKLGMLAYLLATGSLTDNGYLLWDEPEASLNPKLSRATGDLLDGLGGLGIQRFVTTHDYVLASELSLRADAKGPDPRATAFFALGRDTSRKVVVERGARLAELEHNPILDAFVDLHARERAAFLAGEKDRPQ